MQCGTILMAWLMCSLYQHCIHPHSMYYLRSRVVSSRSGGRGRWWLWRRPSSASCSTGWPPPCARVASTGETSFGEGVPLAGKEATGEFRVLKGSLVGSDPPPIPATPGPLIPPPPPKTGTPGPERRGPGPRPAGRRSGPRGGHAASGWLSVEPASLGSSPASARGLTRSQLVVFFHKTFLSNLWNDYFHYDNIVSRYFWV